jgi:hypothetical protein
MHGRQVAHFMIQGFQMQDMAVWMEKMERFKGPDWHGSV